MPGNSTPSAGGLRKFIWKTQSDPRSLLDPFRLRDQAGTQAEAGSWHQSCQSSILIQVPRVSLSPGPGVFKDPRGHPPLWPSTMSPQQPSWQPLYLGKVGKSAGFPSTAWVIHSAPQRPTSHHRFFFIAFFHIRSRHAF